MSYTCTGTCGDGGDAQWQGEIYGSRVTSKRSVVDMLRDLRAWDAPEWRAKFDQYRTWSNELHDALT